MRHSHVSVAGLAAFQRKLLEARCHVIESIFFLGDFGWRLRCGWAVRGLQAFWRHAGMRVWRKSIEKKKSVKHNVWCLAKGPRDRTEC